MNAIDERRLLALYCHYTNARRHGYRLRAAIERINLAVEQGDIEAIRRETKSALDTPPPPNPLADFYKDGYHTGHPYPEYLDLPGTDYIQPPD